MGEYFSKEEEKDEDIEEEDDIDEEYDSIKEIIKERNKIRTEWEQLVNHLRKNIGRLNLSLFGDPRQPTEDSALEELEEELTHPMTRNHPIAERVKYVAEQIRELQREYRKLHKINEDTTKRIGKLLDTAIEMFKEDSVKVKQEAKEDLVVPEHLVTKFMDTWGHDIIKEYVAAWEEGSYSKLWRARNEFMSKGEAFFINAPGDSVELVSKLLDGFSKHSWSEAYVRFRKKGSSSQKPTLNDEEKSQQSALEEKSLKGFNQKQEDLSEEEEKIKSFDK